MIFRRGVCRMSASRSGVRGRASGSASAAAWIWSSVSASARVQSCFVFIVRSIVGPGVERILSLPGEDIGRQVRTIGKRRRRTALSVTVTMAPLRRASSIPGQMPRRSAVSEVASRPCFRMRITEGPCSPLVASRAWKSASSVTQTRAPSARPRCRISPIVWHGSSRCPTRGSRPTRPAASKAAG